MQIERRQPGGYLRWSVEPDARRGPAVIEADRERRRDSSRPSFGRRVDRNACATIRFWCCGRCIKECAAVLS
jgi:hypothetical protein